MTTNPKASRHGRKIWLLTVGSRGDTQPAVALAHRLQAAGHSVKAYGSGFMWQFFNSYDIEFHAYDGPLVLHEDNPEAQAVLDRQAEEAGFPAGPDRVVEYYLDTFVLLYELLLDKYKDMLEMNLPGEEIARILVAATGLIQNFSRTGKGIETLPQRRSEAVKQLERAVRASMKGQDYSGQAERRRARFLTFMKGKAAELGRHPAAFLDGWYSFFLVKAGELKPPAESQKSFVLAFTQWLREDDLDLDGFFEHWWVRLNYRGSDMVSSWLRGTDASKRYMHMKAPHVAAGDRPDLVIYHFSLRTTALLLQSAGLVKKTLDWWPQLPPSDALKQFQQYMFLVAFDIATPRELRFLVNAGPFDYLDHLQSPSLLISASSAFVTDAHCDGDAERQRRLQSCCLGAFTLEERFVRGEDGFGTSAEAELLRGFLEAADSAARLVCFTFGSMPAPSPRELALLVVRAAWACGVRAIFIAGYSGVDREIFGQAVAEVLGDKDKDEGKGKAAEERFLWLSAATHDQLFPHCAVVVHHGGLGTFHSVLRAGAPSVVVPVAVDQWMNGDLGKSLGVAAVTRSLKDLSYVELAATLGAVLASAEARSKAKAIASTMQQERGVEAAVEFVEKFLAEPEQAPPAKVEVPWKSGIYLGHFPGVPDPVPMEIKGDKQVLNDDPIAWLRYGSFKRKGDEKTEYNVQLCSAVVQQIGLYKMSKDGRKFVGGDGSWFEYAEKGWMWIVLPVLVGLVAVGCTLFKGC